MQQENSEPVDPKSARKKYSWQVARDFSLGLTKEQYGRITKKTQLFYNFKGGTGKTTLNYQLSFMLSLMGFRVLSVDLDPQAHLSNMMRFEESGDFRTMYDVLINGYDIRESISEVVDGLDVVPANLRLTKMEIPLSQKTRREEVLLKHINQIKDEYDFIFFDTNPTISTMNMNALFAADQVNIVCETQPLSLNGLGILVEELECLFRDMGKDFNFIIVPNKYEIKTAIAQEVLGVLRADYRENLTQSVIRKCEDFNMASKVKEPVFAFAGKSSAAYEDLLDLCHEVLSMSTVPIEGGKKK
jgi:chromosome partitioning protein